MLNITPEQLKLVAIAVHAAYVKWKTSQGWTFGPLDPEKKTTPMVEPDFDQLDKATQDADYATAQAVIETLYELGFVIVNKDQVEAHTYNINIKHSIDTETLESYMNLFLPLVDRLQTGSQLPPA